jgi:hypothetical protein
MPRLLIPGAVLALVSLFQLSLSAKRLKMAAALGAYLKDKRFLR